MHWTFVSRILVGTCLLGTTPSAMSEIQRTSAGHPDLTGTYDSGTLTLKSGPRSLGIDSL